MTAIRAIRTTANDTLELVEIPTPTITEPFDILVRVKGIGLNPADIKVRTTPGKILGYDATGIVEAAGPSAVFKPGDEVFYAGSASRDGSNSELQLVDSRIVARKPRNLAWDEAAAIPLVGLTAWEMLEEKFHLTPSPPGGANKDLAMIVVNAAGGVGTMALFLASKVFNIGRVIATASRPETIEWVKRFGATDVINHREPLGPQLGALNVQLSHAFLCHDTPTYVEQLVPHMQPFGHIGSIVGTTTPVPIGVDAAFFRALSFSWEVMFTKTLFGYQLESQGHILEKLAKLAEEGALPSLVTRSEVFSLAKLREAHELQASEKVYGKIVFRVPDTWQ
jgi:zinc-binding alcohol dehydrogenase family protein